MKTAEYVCSLRSTSKYERITKQLEIDFFPHTILSEKERERVKGKWRGDLMILFQVVVLKIT